MAIVVLCTYWLPDKSEHFGCEFGMSLHRDVVMLSCCHMVMWSCCHVVVMLSCRPVSTWDGMRLVLYEKQSR